MVSPFRRQRCARPCPPPLVAAKEAAGAKSDSAGIAGALAQGSGSNAVEIAHSVLSFDFRTPPFSHHQTPLKMKLHVYNRSIPVTFLCVAAFACFQPLAAAPKAESKTDTANIAAALSVPREELHAAMHVALFPSPAEIPEPSYKIIAKTDAGDHERWKVRYTVDKGEEIEAWLLVPKPLPAPGVRLPLVLALHPTYDGGKDRVLDNYDKPPADETERAKRENRAYGKDLVQHGFVVFAPDRVAYGERRLLPKTENYRKQMPASQKVFQEVHPRWGHVAKAVWDLQRALDFLVTLDFVDPQRIGSVGHSLGAWDTVVLGAMDERVKAIAVSHCGSLRFRPELWSDETALRAYLKKTEGLNTNLNVYLMLLAPRSQLFFWSVREHNDKAPNQIEALRTVSAFNQQTAKRAGAKLDFSFYLHTAGHDFPSDSRALAWEWFKMRLK
jgi:dienelactone hydrolase